MVGSPGSSLARRSPILRFGSSQTLDACEALSLLILRRGGNQALLTEGLVEQISQLERMAARTGK